MVLKSLILALGVMGASIGGASALTIGFDADSISGHPWGEGGFIFTSNKGTTNTSNDCSGPCLQLGNNEVIKMVQKDGLAFDLLSFAYNGKDNPNDDADGALYIALDEDFTVAKETFDEFDNANVMATATPSSAYLGVFSVYFTTSGIGSSRIDDVEISAVPLPASGLLLLAGLGGLAMKRRRKS